jgi:hypothetical protein
MTLELAGALFVFLLIVLFLAPNPAKDPPAQPALVVMPAPPVQEEGQSNVPLLLLALLLTTVVVLLVTG